MVSLPSAAVLGIAQQSRSSTGDGQCQNPGSQVCPNPSDSTNKLIDWSKQLAAKELNLVNLAVTRTKLGSIGSFRFRQKLFSAFLSMSTRRRVFYPRPSPVLKTHTRHCKLSPYICRSSRCTSKHPKPISPESSPCCFSSHSRFLMRTALQGQENHPCALQVLGKAPFLASAAMGKRNVTNRFESRICTQFAARIRAEVPQKWIAWC